MMKAESVKPPVAAVATPREPENKHAETFKKPCAERIPAGTKTRGMHVFVPAPRTFFCHIPPKGSPFLILAHNTEKSIG